MPQAVKQVARPADNGRPAGSVAERIRPVGPKEGGIKLLLYGRGKTGKTRLACTFPKPLLLIGTEDGTKSVEHVKGVDFVRLSNSAEVDELAALLDGGKYKTCALDTAGGLQELIVKEVLGLDDVPVQKSWGMAQQRDWGVIGMQLKERLHKLLALADRQALNVVCIAHERNFNEDAGSELITPTVGAALTPSATGWLNGACDYICQTFIRQGMTTVAGEGGQETKIPTGKMEYCLRVGPHAVFMTGFRLPFSADKLPDAIVNPDHAKIVKLIRGGQ